MEVGGGHGFIPPLNSIVGIPSPPLTFGAVSAPSFLYSFFPHSARSLSPWPLEVFTDTNVYRTRRLGRAWLCRSLAEQPQVKNHNFASVSSSVK